jgi:hypothetical protein
MQDLHPIDLLFNKLKDISPYPDGVIPVPKRFEQDAGAALAGG